jgi:hypothetical protein
MPVYVHFTGSVARLEAIGKPVTAGITMTPPVKGEWRWASDQMLTFTPAEDWAVGQEYKVALDRTLFPDHVLLDAYEITQAPRIIKEFTPFLCSLLTLLIVVAVSLSFFHS